MDYEKAYNEALERAKKFANSNYRQERYTVEEIFPELKESEDEKIREQVVYAINQLHVCECTKNKLRAWLEKQGEPNPYSGVTFEYNGHTWGMCARENGVDILLDKQLFKHLEKKGEQKPADKVGPKFHEGEWIVSDYNNVAYIESISETKYNLQCIDGFHEKMSIEYVDRCWHLWTIQDAKPGDVLACENDIVIFKENSYNPKDQSGCMFVYCSCNNFYEIGGINPTDYKPATKEQRDLLFQKMKEAGYEWDAEKKELKKIEQESAEWSEEDKFHLKSIESTIEYCKKEVAENDEARYLFNEDLNWLKSLKDRVQPQPKQEWSEYDKIQLDEAIQMIEANGTWIRSEDAVKKVSNWLKSLKPQPRWKPSDEQMKAIKYFIDFHRPQANASTEGWNEFKHLESLYNDLKSL